MFRDPATDQAYLVTSPSNTRQSVVSSPSFTATDLPGAWPLQSGRRYGGAGLGPDGTLCVKNFENLPGGAYTTNTNTVYMCGKNNGGTWTWNQLVTHYLGVRHAYDYIFPGAINNYAGFVAVAQRDTLANSDGYPNVASGFYMFNGVKYYSTGYDSNATWTEHYIAAPIDDPFKVNTTTVPTKRPTDAFIDSHGYLITSYYITYPDDPSLNGEYVVVTDVHGTILLEKKWSFLQPYGKTIIFEDGGQQLWLIWLNRGSRATQLQVFPIERITSPTFDLNVTDTSGTDVSAAVGSSAIGGTIYLTRERSGTSVSNFVEGLMPMCGEFPDLAGSCNASTLRKIYYFRLRLPGSGIAPPSSAPVITPVADVTPSKTPVLGPGTPQVSAAQFFAIQFDLLVLITLLVTIF